MKPAFDMTNKIAEAAIPKAREYSARDSEVRGLQLRVQPNGAKSWVLRLMELGRQRRLTLGKQKSMTVEQAREAARNYLKTGSVNGNLQKPITFAEFDSIYRKRMADAWKPSVLAKYERLAETRLVSAFGQRAVCEISRSDVANWFLVYSQRAPGGANYCLQVLHAMFARASQWGHVPPNFANPCTGIKKNRRKPRGRLLNTEELSRLGESLEKLADRNRDVADLIFLLMLTGARLGEIRTLRWTEVEATRLNLADSKTGARQIVLGSHAIAILKRRRGYRSKSEWVFPSPMKRKKPRQDIYWSWCRIRDEAGLDASIRIHDLRHSYASHALMGGATMMVTGALLGHRRLSTTNRYAHLSGKHLLAAAQQVASRISGWLMQ